MIIEAEDDGWIANLDSDGHILPIILSSYIFENLQQKDDLRNKIKL